MRSSASTWIATTKLVACPRPSCTSIRRSGSRCSDFAFGQSTRCTHTPCPRVTNPMISSPGTGVQHRAEAAPTRRWRPGRRRPSRPSSCAGLTGRASGTSVTSSLVGAGDEPRQARHHRLRRDVPLPDRHVQRVEVRVPSGRAATCVERLLGRQALERDVLLAHQPAAARRGRAPARPRGAPRQNHCRILFRARGVFTNWSQSWLGPSPCAFDVRTSTVSPVRSS